MALYKRGKTWWIDIGHCGKRLQRSAGTEDKITAQKLHDKLKSELWNTSFLDAKPEKIWMDAVVRWLEESQHKRSLYDDKVLLRWLDPHLKKMSLNQITRDLIDQLIATKKNEGCKPASINRMLAIIRAILRKAEREWEWIEKAPVIRLLKEDNKRIRWITHEEAIKLINELPQHLAAMATFSLATGLRQSNVTGLQWSDVDLIKRHALIHPDQAKGKRAIPVPLNEDAISVLRKQIGKHHQFVFTFKGNRIIQCSTKAWKKATDYETTQPI